MARYKNARKVNYLVQRDCNTGNYFVIMLGKNDTRMIKKTKSGWYAEGLYHPTLRDAIVYVLYGV